MSGIVKQQKFLNKISATTVKPQIILDVSKYSALNVKFQYQNFNGHMGARKFWHEFLPSLQFYNPALPINVTRIRNDDKKVDVPCILEAIGSDGKVVAEVSMKHKHSSEIMDEVLQKLEHKRVPQEEIIKV
ncbi:mitochondrial 54S ribosomal protein mL61 [Kluyveromyces lactis]|uniref:KLLA0B07183p n=1 Tax=Kluyveromyces lactis (strain ATCC 8585 / CBS 2359 / DSM 70799 / NBRC 1267 / NRRL Y-1140 / WM37) TaxID=284590 RepID=Q6CW39_KLULA|nr:mitochondrial 54S ribosomal protein MRP49 [Kluyveromyces lactis]CAH02243.1 KLLA0B07183p [Kluyveromyces lactis]|eukprot:XP_451850.1 mitochondrial 54S ribosomal protein MRP49 [Kluyveromyces lactis]